jgi:putative ABC transport system permease protein
MIANYFFLAIKNVRKRGIRSWLTMLGIFLGIAAVVSLISLGQGLEEAIVGQFGAALSTDTLTVSSAETGFGPPGSTAVRKLTKRDLEIIDSTPNVVEVIPRLVRIATVEYNDEKSFHFIGSAPPKQEQLEILYESINIDISKGKLIKATDRGKVLLGDDFVSESPFSKDIRIGQSITIQGKDFEVAGFLKRASTFTLNSVVFMTEEDMKDLLDIDDEIDLIVVKVESEEVTEKVAEEIERKFRKDRKQKPGEEDFAVQTPVQALSSVSTFITVVNIVVSGIAGISLLIGGVGIANTMFTSVLERTREIGVMKAVGARRRDIMNIFIIESGLLGLVGGIVGAAIGLGLALLASGAANAALNNTIFLVRPNISLLIGSIAFSFLIGVFSGMIPAYQASKLEPVEALRK